MIEFIESVGWNKNYHTNLHVVLSDTEGVTCVLDDACSWLELHYF